MGDSSVLISREKWRERDVCSLAVWPERPWVGRETKEEEKYKRAAEIYVYVYLKNSTLIKILPLGFFIYGVVKNAECVLCTSRCV